jgi:chaperonin GroEL
MLVNIATISANGDKDIADVVVKAVMAAGDDGTVLIEEGQGNTMSVDTIDGYIVTTGLKEFGQIGPVFVNDKSHQQVKLDNGFVFLFDGALNDLKIPSAIQECIADVDGSYDGTPILVFAHEFADIVLEKFAKAVKGGVMIIPVKTPRSGLPNGASLFLHDMAAYSGATVRDPGTISELSEQDFGDFDAFKMNMYETFLSCTPDMERLNTRVDELKSILDVAFSEFDKSFLKAAIGKLTGGVSTIWVGGLSDLEVREKKARVEDAVEAVRSAIAEGVIPGGCTVHLKLATIVESHPKYLATWSILSEALLAPFWSLMYNCGESPDEVIGMLTPSDDWELPNKVFDANEHSLVEPMQSGIIEPAKVCRVSVGNALSIASLLITLGGIVVVPRDYGLESQLELSKDAFQNMMSTVEQ